MAETKRRTRGGPVPPMVKHHTIWHHHHLSEVRSELEQGIRLLMIPLSIGVPLLDIPQLLQVWISHRTTGVNIWTWGGYSVTSLAWLAYGIVQKDKMIIISEALFMVLDGLVALGLLVIR